MLLFLERDQFIKLLRFGELSLPVNRFLDVSFSNAKANLTVEIIDSKVPLFEQDHEVLILDIPKEKLQINNEIKLKISFIRSIFPLTSEAQRYLIGRLNPNIKLQAPYFENVILQLKKVRDFKLRSKASEALCKLFKIDKNLAIPFEKEIEVGINARLNYSQPKKKDSYIASLMAFNRNPVYPSGQVEYLLKAASVFVEMKGGTEEEFETGPLFAYLMNNAKSFVYPSPLESLKQFSIQNEAKPILSQLSETYPNINAFFIGFFFLLLKDKLNKNEYDLKPISDEIKSIQQEIPTEAAIITAMLGILFNFDTLYESIYKLSDIPIFREEVEPDLSEKLNTFKQQRDNLLEVKEQLSIENEKLKADVSNLTNENAMLKQSIAKQQDDQSKPIIKPVNEEIGKHQPAISKENNALSETNPLLPQTSAERTEIHQQQRDPVQKPDDSEKSSEPNKNEDEKPTEIYKPNGQTPTLAEPKEEYSKSSASIDKSKAKSQKTRKQHKQSSATINFPDSHIPTALDEQPDYFFEMHEIEGIIDFVLQERFFNNRKTQEAFREAFLNYQPKGATLHYLLNEIEELQKDHNFSAGIAGKIKSYIISKSKIK